jgi:RimJ/RimL family protein N-acetyltransferase
MNPIHFDMSNNGELSELLCTCRPENIASMKLMEAVGMRFVKEEYSYGHQKMVFMLSGEDILSRAEVCQRKKINCFTL